MADLFYNYAHNLIKKFNDLNLTSAGPQLDINFLLMKSSHFKCTPTITDDTHF